MPKTLGMRWLVVAAGAAMLLVLGAACAEKVEVPGETIIVEKRVVKTVEVPGETIVVEKEVVKTVEVEVPGETVTVTKEVIKEVEVPGETVVVTKEVIKEVEVPGKTVVVEKEVLKVVEVRQGYVTDPSTGEVVTAPEYGGTLTVGYPYAMNILMDPYSAWPDPQTMGVVEKLAIANWGIDRDEWDLKSANAYPPFVVTGRLAESWETPDPLTYIFHIRDGVRWHNKVPMNGRLLTAQDVEFNFHRMLGLGDFTDVGPSPFGGASKIKAIPFESIAATDDSTVVMKLTEPYLPAFQIITQDLMVYIMPPEVIKETGTVRIGGTWSARALYAD